MKKLLCVLIAVTLISALLLVPASAKGKVVDIKFEGEHIAVRAGAKLEYLYDGSILSEADAGAGSFEKTGIVLVQNTNCTSEVPSECTVTFELESLTDIDTVYITWFVYGNAMIGLPHENALIIGTSQDGVVFDENAYTIEGEPSLTESFQLESKVRLNSAVKAKFVSVTFSMGPNNQGWDKVSWEWVGFTEFGAGLQADEILDGGYNEVSQEESIPLEEIDPIVEIPEGATAIKHVPFDRSITTGSTTIVTDPASMHNYNVVWTTCALLRPTETEGAYEVVAVQWLNGDSSFMFADAAEGDIVLAIHGDDEADGSKANRDALTALPVGEIVTFAGYNFEERTFETGAVVYFGEGGEGNGETSDTPDDETSATPDDESTPADDESAPADDESAPADDESAPATSDTDVSEDKGDDKGGNTGLIIGIVVGVVAVIAVVVVVVIVVKKKK